MIREAVNCPAYYAKTANPSYYSYNYFNYHLLGQEKGSLNLTHPKREPLSRLWFLSRSYKQADPRYTKGRTVWLHPETNDVLGCYGQKLTLQEVPLERHLKTRAKYLKLRPQDGDMYLARLKYLTFKGDIPAGYTIDHIDGNTFNNDIRNLRAVPPAINYRDGGFMRKLRNNGIRVEFYSGIILEGYERLARWKETHTKWQYSQLKGDELKQIFVGPSFRIAGISTDELMDLELNKHADPFIERN